MTPWEAIILGLVQGLTEFLPVSSSGHLVLGQYLLGVQQENPSIAFEVFVHFGTLMSVVTIYRREVATILFEIFDVIRQPQCIGEHYKSKEGFRTAFQIGITMIPTGIVYLLFKDPLEAAFQDPRLVCAMLIVTGIVLLLTGFRKKPTGDFTIPKAFWVGLAQSMAMIPGISRSGSTIATALYCNVDRKKAAEFSFLMSIPVILIATLLKTKELLETGESIQWLPMILGVLVAFGSGLWAIRIVIGFVVRGKLQYFAYYCFATGTLGLIFIR
jgi:undecaprenyl-diphosphatase